MKTTVFNLLTTLLLLCGMSCSNKNEISTEPSNDIIEVVSGEWKFEGHLGSYIDKI